MPEFVWELPSVRPEPEESGAVAEGAIDHVDAALRRLVIQFQKPKFKAMVEAFVTPLMDLEQCIVDCLTNRTLDTAIGEQLNVLGRIVGQDQVDVTDTTYRSLIRARIPANKSSGMGDEVLNVSRLVLSDYAAQEDVVAAGTMALQIVHRGNASFVLRVENMDLPWDLAELLVEQFLRGITGTGIRAILEFTVQEDEPTEGFITAFESDFIMDDAWPASVTITDRIRIDYLVDGTDGNGYQVKFQSSGGFPAFLDEGTPGISVINIEEGVTTWADVYTLIGTSTFIEVGEEIEAGATVFDPGDYQTRTLTGGIDATCEGFGDADHGYGITNVGANNSAPPANWTHIHLCDDASTQDSAELGGLTLAEAGSPIYHGAGIEDGDYAFGIGTGNADYFVTSSAALQPTATSDWGFACVVPELGSGETNGIALIASIGIGTPRHIVVAILNGQLLFQAYDGTDLVQTAPLAVPDGPFTVMAVLDRSGGAKMRSGVCPIGGTAVVSAEVDASAIGSLLHGDQTYIGNGDGTTPTYISYWMAFNADGDAFGLSADLQNALQTFTDNIPPGGGLRSAAA